MNEGMQNLKQIQELEDRIKEKTIPTDVDNDFICGVQLQRIADAIEEILRLVKKDMEPRTKKKD